MFVPRRKKKNKLASSLSGGILFLSVISLVSVGFSTWTIGSNNANATFNMGADDVDGTNKYFFFNENSDSIDKNYTNPPVLFEYNDYGIINKGVVSSQGKFAFFMAVLLRGENGIYKDNETLTEFSFKYLVTCTGAPLLDYLSSVSFKVSDRDKKYNPPSNNGSISNDKKVIALTYNGDRLTNTTDYLFYRVELSFDFVDVTTFKTTIADKMSSTNLSFEVLFGDEII